MRITAAALLLAGCGNTASPARSTSAERPPDIYLITVDTVRADHLPMYGYHRPTSPWLAGLASEGVVFEHAMATSSWTVPSVASFLTGMLPHQLGISDVPSKPTVSGEIRRVPDTARTIAERLAEVGYDTVAVTTNAHLTQDMGYHQGFDSYTNVGFQSADAVSEALEPLLPRLRKHDKPLFLWIHLFDPHDPYRMHSPWVEDWAEDQTGLEELGTLPMRDLNERGGLELGEPALAQLEALYDAEIAYADQMLQATVAKLGVGPDDVLIFTSDHGEEFRDHGNLGHRLTLYDETVRVPLVVWSPDRWTAGRRDERVSLVEILPTIGELAGAEVGPYGGVSTRSLVPLLEGRIRAPGPSIVSDLTRQNGPRWRAIYEGDRKLILVGDPVERSMLFDLDKDPAEKRNLFEGRPKEAIALRKALGVRLRSAQPLAPQTMDGEVSDDVREQLKAMGYLDEDE